MRLFFKNLKSLKSIDCFFKIQNLEKLGGKEINEKYTGT